MYLISSRITSDKLLWLIVHKKILFLRFDHQPYYRFHHDPQLKL